MSGRRLRGQIVPLVAIFALAAFATAIGFYIVREQRLRMPWDDIYTVTADFTTGQALTPGQGQAVTVAGVKVGEIARVRLQDGRARVDLAIERDRLPEVHRDATMLIRPRTPLQDMTIDVDPGSAGAPRLEEGDVLGTERTTPSVNVDEVLATLDRDTRDYATMLVQGLGHGVKDRGDALRAALRASAPTLRAIRRVNAAVAARRRELRRAASSLRQLTTAVAREDRSLGRLVSAANATFGALASEDDALRLGLERLPGTLVAAEDALRQARPLARATGPALRALTPAVRRLPETLRRVEPLLVDGVQPLRTLRALSREARPLARQLTPAARDLTAQTPELTETFGVLRYLTNLFAYNPPGDEEGYLFWLAWFGHNMNSFVSGQDGNGPFWRGMAMFSCSSGINDPLTAALVGPFVDELDVCPGPGED